jgi:hypothetical protein
MMILYHHFVLVVVVIIIVVDKDHRVRCDSIRHLHLPKLCDCDSDCESAVCIPVCVLAYFLAWISSLLFFLCTATLLIVNVI